MLPSYNRWKLIDLIFWSQSPCVRLSSTNSTCIWSLPVMSKGRVEIPCYELLHRYVANNTLILNIWSAFAIWGVLSALTKGILNTTVRFTLVRVGGLLYLCGLRFLQFLAAVFWFFTNISAVFRFCRLLRFAEMDVFLTRFSVLSYICSGFSVFEKYAVCGYSLPYCVLRFAGISPLITACALRQWDAANDLWSPCKWTMYGRYLSVRSIDIF